MGDNPDGTSPAISGTVLAPLCLSGLVFPPSISNMPYSLQGLHFERRWGNRRENRLPTGPPEGLGGGTHTVTPPPIVVNHEQSFGPSFPPTSRTDPGKIPVGFFTEPQGAPSNASLPRRPQ